MDTVQPSYSQRMAQEYFASTRLPTWGNTLLKGDAHLPRDYYGHLAQRAPFPRNRFVYAVGSSVGGMAAVPAAFARTVLFGPAVVALTALSRTYHRDQQNPWIDLSPVTRAVADGTSAVHCIWKGAVMGASEVPSLWYNRDRCVGFRKEYQKFCEQIALNGTEQEKSSLKEFGVVALLGVDPQTGFCDKEEHTDNQIEGIGELTVSGSRASVEELARFFKQAHSGRVFKVLTRDWHPRGHGSFASAHGKNPFDRAILNGQEQFVFSDHCIANTPGAEFHPAFQEVKKDVQFVIDKGVVDNDDSFGAFGGNTKKKNVDGSLTDQSVYPTELGALLKAAGVQTVVVGGLAEDYCVKASAIQALAHGFNVILLEDGTRGCDSSKDGRDKVLKELEETAKSYGKTVQRLPIGEVIQKMTPYFIQSQSVGG